MDDQMFLSALSSFNNTLANAANVQLAAQTSSQDRKFSREMSDLAWERNIQAWNMQNEYNTPANQYARQLEGLRVNGLNPNLVYGSSSNVTGAAGGVSPFKFEGYHSTAVPQFKGVDSLQSFLTSRLLQTQVAAQEAQNRLINARADNEEARLPGLQAKSDEAKYRWDYIYHDISDDYEAAIRAQVATEYWKGVQVEYNASYSRDRSKLEYIEAVTAEWLNETQAPGTGMTYRQYMESCKAFLPGAQFSRFKSDVLDIASRIAYRAKQGNLLDKKIEFQTYVNRLAKYGRSLGNDWVTLLLSGLEQVFNGDNDSIFHMPIFDPETGQMQTP